MPPFQFRLPQIQDLTLHQRRALNEYERPIIVTGVPGCGKTVVSIWRLLSSTRPTRLITYTNMLKTAISHLTNIRNANKANYVYTVDEWFVRYCNVFLAKGNEDRQRLESWVTRYPIADHNNSDEIFSALVRIGAFGYDLIIDEGQDLHSAIYKALKKANLSISIGADEAQQLYRNIDTNEAILRQIFTEQSHRYIPLTKNFRNRYEIFNFARHFVPENPNANSINVLEDLRQERAGGNMPYIYVLHNHQEILNILKRIIENNMGGNIGILLDSQDSVDRYYDYINSFTINNQSVECSKYHNRLPKAKKLEIENDLKNILVTTYKSAKGLEFDTVIMPEFENAITENKKHYYVGASRARESLFILCLRKPKLIDSRFDGTYLLL